MTRYHKILCVVFILILLWSGITPVDRTDWLLENIPTAVWAPLILLAGRYFKLSNISYTLITIYLTLHVIGSHYTYGQVPFGFTLQEWFGSTRNLYDRLVHFSFGFLLTYPVREVFMRLAKVKGFWSYYLPLDVVAAFSAAYEVLEWIVARNISPEAGLAFLGTQGDVWDTQKDMLMSIIGSFLALVVIAILQWRRDKNFWDDMKEGFKIPNNDKPLDEFNNKKNSA